MKKLLFNVVSMLILSICVLSCSKKDDDVTPISASEIVGEWTISQNPAIDIKVPEGYQAKIKDTLQILFKKDDSYVFNENLTCVVTRGSSTAPYPNRYKIEGGSIIFDDYIRFNTNVSGNQVILTAGNAEIRDIVKKELQKRKGEVIDGAEITDATIETILKTVSGKVEFVLQKK